MAGRGELTTQVQKKAREFFDREITQTELRLMPYIQYVMTNEQRIDPNKINREERDILAKWKEEGRIEGGAGGLSITYLFWRTISELVFMAYVDYRD